MDSMALGLLSRRESRKDLWPRLILLLLYIMLICTLLYAARCLKMLVFDRLGLSPSLLAFCSLVHRYSPFPLIQMPTLFRFDVSLASTLDEYSRLLCYLFFPYTRLLRPDDESQEPDDATDDYYYPEDAYYYVETADDQE